jgi:FixJ family two-component response regulator
MFASSTDKKDSGGLANYWAGRRGTALLNEIIAVVDDDESMREAVEALVRSLGYRAVTFSSAEEFLRSPAIDEIACLIADLQMPGLSGIDLRNRLVTLGQPIPTILITAHPDDRTRRLALKAGILCYLTKPFSDDELIACLQKAIIQKI